MCAHFFYRNPIKHHHTVRWLPLLYYLNGMKCVWNEKFVAANWIRSSATLNLAVTSTPQSKHIQLSRKKMIWPKVENRFSARFRLAGTGKNEDESKLVSFYAWRSFINATNEKNEESFDFVCDVEMVRFRQWANAPISPARKSTECAS